MPYSKIYAILPPVTSCNIERICFSIQVLLSYGVRYFQYRNKTHSFSQNKILLKRVFHEIKKQPAAYCLVNDSVRLMKSCDCDGIHIGQNDGNIKRIRKDIGSSKLLGVSCYNNLDRAILAQNLKANYVSFGCLFPSKTKPKAPTCDLSLVKKAKKNLHIPVVVIGGITLQELPTLHEVLKVHLYALSYDLFSAA